MRASGPVSGYPIYESEESLLVADEAFALVALSFVRGVGFHTLTNAKNKHLPLWDILSADAAESALMLRSCGGRIDTKFSEQWKNERSEAIARAEAQLAEYHKQNISIIMRGDRLYPASLFDLPDPPHWLFVQGDSRLLSSPAITIVGTRTPSSDGLWLSTFVGHCLPYWNRPTVSGLALGIDQSIHQTSIDVRLPTIAILGTGINSNYPKNSEAMRNEIVSAGGAIVTEYLPDDTYSGENFVRRNRLQAALGKVLIPVEWKQKSGTAHTVRFAQRLRRPIASVQLPTWPADLKHFDNKFDQRAFNIPGDENAFREFVTSSLKGQQRNVERSLDLFGEN